MEVIQVLFDPILPVFAIAVIGYIAGKLGKVSIDDARVLNKFAVNILLPIFIFGLIAKTPIENFSLAPVVSYAGIQWIVFAVSFILAHKVFKRDAAESVLLGFACVFANNAYYVLPISILIYGDNAVLPVSAIVTLDAVITVSVVMIALQMINLGRFSLGNIVTTLAKTPLLHGVILGVIVNLAHIPLPASINTFVDFAGVGTAPIALFSLGVVMSGVALKPDGLVTTLSVIKILLFPALVWFALETFADNDTGKTLFLLASAGPAGVTAMNLALYYDIRSEAIAKIIIWTSILTLFSLAVLA